ncbi:aromatic ring-hydroxylating dioxygenase subunit alpha [Novosphingobium profundi]|uniref:aromatic ring-hydroxylating dioxygenase subunit alpha n=1 Tax=Novosphingobium profundi TaxID=1774954 RepID=UPI001CFC5E31|nr:aromatic ring-hydroxylating dioxygenase subunit alpha [Novosphingobium profundi]
MYPFTTDTGIVRNRWYMAGFSSEITRQPMERTILGKPVALYRKEDGTPVAMYGLCPHRYFPLAKGRVRGDALVCGYHGFAFDADGKCIEVPSQNTGSGFCQPTYPIEERGPLCWIWMGDGDRCDPALIPPYSDFGLEQEGWRYSSENYFHLKGRSQLLVDNLLDLTHLPYVHHHIGGGGVMASPKLEESEGASLYQVLRRSKMPWDPFLELLFGKEAAYEGLADFRIVSDFYGPELIRTSMPVITTGAENSENPSELGALWIMHAITPETEHSTHYFGFAVRNFRHDSAELDEFQRQSDIKIRQQDVDAIEAVEERLDAASAVQRELLVKSDGPAVKVRRKIQAMLDAEAAPIMENA